MEEISKEKTRRATVGVALFIVTAWFSLVVKKRALATLLDGLDQ